MIELFAPRLTSRGGVSRLCAQLCLDGEKTELWFETETAFEHGFICDRLDGFVLSVLPHAMMSGQDILCHEGVSRQLLYSLNEILIPAVSRKSERYRKITVRARPAPARSQLPDGVATGYSGGADSLYSLLAHRQREDGMNLTHLAVFQVGPYEGADRREKFREGLRRSKRFGQQVGLPVVGLDSNITELFDEHYLSVASFRLCAAAMILGGLWRTYLLSSAYPFSSFCMDEKNIAYADLLLVGTLSTPDLRFYSSGGNLRRIDKLKAIAHAPSDLRNSLHVCVRRALPGQPNCCLCLKCIRTLLALESMGVLQDFAEAFPPQIIEQNRRQILMQALLHRDNEHFREVLQTEAMKKAVSELLDRDPQFFRRLAAADAAAKVAEKNRAVLKEKLGK